MSESKLVVRRFDAPAAVCRGASVRVVGTPDAPMFVLADLCAALGNADPSTTARRLDDDEKAICIVEHFAPTLSASPHNTQQPASQMLCVTEAGLYHVILTSRAENAATFRRWVTHDVLPEIRRTGSYSPPAQTPLGPYTRRVMDAWRTQGSVPDGYWCVFAEGASVLILAELVFAPSGLEMQQYDLLDGSIGRHWADHRRDRPWAGERVRYRHAFPPGDPRGRVQAWAYPMAEVGHFKGWLRHDYLPTHFPAYLERKYGLDRLRLAAPEMARRGLPLRLPALQAGPAG